MTVLALLLMVLGLPTHAHAYIDPSAGSILLQLLLGGIAGVLVAVRLYWRRLTGLLGRRREATTAEERDRTR